MNRRAQTAAVFLILALGCAAAPRTVLRAEDRLLYVAGKGSIRVYDMDSGHRLLRKIKIKQAKKIRGIVANAKTRRFYISYKENNLACFDLRTDALLWTKKLDSGADRLAITPDGQTIYLPSGSWRDTPYWYVIDTTSGEVRSKITFFAGTHNTLVGPSGKLAYLASLRHNMLAVIDTSSNEIVREVGPFGGFVRPFTINADESLVFATVDDLLGFEMADLKTGKILHRVKVAGEKRGPVRRHRCPSHGIGLHPTGKEAWVVDAHNRKLHVFDVATLPPVSITSIDLADEPYWVSFSIEGDFAYASTGDVIDTRTRMIVATLRKNNGKRLQSEKMLEIDFRGDVPIRVGNQFGIGRTTDGSFASCNNSEPWDLRRATRRGAWGDSVFIMSVAESRSHATCAQ